MVPGDKNKKDSSINTGWTAGSESERTTGISGGTYNELEQERNLGRIETVPGRGCATNCHEEKGLTERVDARYYEERGIDKIPMVHEGPNVQAMEARGISTALGSLNRLIRALNDMKERAKNLLQWSLLRQSQLMERMAVLASANFSG